MKLKFQYRPGNSFFHKMDPSIKFIWMVIIVLLLFIMTDPFSVLGLLVLQILMGKIGAKMGLIEMARALVIIAPAALTVSLLNIFVIGDLLYGAAMGLRMLAVVIPGVIFSKTTDPRRLTFSLVQVLKFPYMFGFMINTAYRFVPIFEDELNSITNAHIVRGVDMELKGIRGRFKKLQITVEPLLIGVIRRSQLTSMAVQNRAFGAYPNRTYTYVTKATKWDKIFLAAWIISFFIYAFTLGTPSQLLSTFMPWAK